MEIRIARSDEEIHACFPVVHELRPLLAPEGFLERVRGQQADGYELAFLTQAGRPVAAAGFRFLTTLVDGRHLYVDDLVVLESERSKGHGGALVRWLRDHAQANGGASVQLDSGVSREDAHRFYAREGFERSGYHFTLGYGEAPASGPAQRPWWMTWMAGVCLAALLINVPRDLFFPELRDVEVWLGFEVEGWLAHFTAPFHWAIFVLGAWAFWRGDPRVVPWAAAYVFYVALSHLVWSEASPNGNGWHIGLLQAVGISFFGVLLLRAHRRAWMSPG